MTQAQALHKTSLRLAERPTIGVDGLGHRELCDRHLVLVAVHRTRTAVHQLHAVRTVVEGQYTGQARRESRNMVAELGTGVQL